MPTTSTRDVFSPDAAVVDFHLRIGGIFSGGLCGLSHFDPIFQFRNAKAVK